ncbi:MAG: sulfotransferase [Pseudomonadota bacterium]
MAIPDFLIIGAMKSGTTTLQAQLAAQTGIFMTTPKEPNYFSDDDVYARGAAWYAGLFEGALPGDLKGEASTHYTKIPTHPHTLERMRPVLAAPRLVYMIRNPVARAVSHYLHAWSQGVVSTDVATAFAARSDFTEYGRYALQIAPFLEAYGPEAVLLTSLEEMTADPDAMLARVAAHIGLESAVRWNADIDAQNVSAERYRRLPLHGFLIDNPVAEALRRTLVPKAWRTALREARRPPVRPELPADLRARLEATFIEDRAALARLFPAHRALELCYPFARDLAA